MSILIEKGTCDDIDKIEKLYNDLNDALETGENYPGWKKGVYPVRANAVEGISNNDLFVVRKENEIVGTVILNHKTETDYDGVTWQYDCDCSHVFYIHTLVVHPAFSKLGIGRRLVEFAESFGREHDIKAVRLDVHENNAPAIKLYESSGFHYVATMEFKPEGHRSEWFRLYEKVLFN